MTCHPARRLDRPVIGLGLDMVASRRWGGAVGRVMPLRGRRMLAEEIHRPVERNGVHSGYWRREG